MNLHRLQEVVAQAIEEATMRNIQLTDVPVVVTVDGRGYMDVDAQGDDVAAKGSDINKFTFIILTGQ